MEDVNNLTKEEFLKFSNCDLHGASTKQEKIIVTGPQNQKLSILKQFGKYTASEVQLDECALNRQVLRIPLPIVDIKKLPVKQVALKFSNQKLSVLKQFGKYTASEVQLDECALNRQVLRIPLPIVDIKKLPVKQVALKLRNKKNKQKKRNVGLSRLKKQISRVSTRASTRRPLRILQKEKDTKSEAFQNEKKSNPVAFQRERITKLEALKKLKVIKPEPFDKNNTIKLEPIQKDKNIKVESFQRFKYIIPIALQKTKSTNPQASQKDKNSNLPQAFKKIKNIKQKTSSNNKFKVYEKKKKPNIIKPQIPSKSKNTLQQQMAAEPTYFLKMAPLKDPEDGKLQYPFENLVKDIKDMELPSTTWKIKVVVKNNKIASIIFTNKCVLERSVSFDAKCNFYQIVIENKPAILLGSPNDVSCAKDVEILLNIIHTISAEDCMIFYKK